MRKKITFLLVLFLCLNYGIVFAHGATYEVRHVGENTVDIVVTAGPEQTKGIEVRSYTVRAGNTININYGYSGDGQNIDIIKIDTRTVLFPARILLTNVDEEQRPLFPDIEGIKNPEYIMHLHDAGIIEGRPDGTYRPYDSITRAEFVTIITKALGIGEEVDEDNYQFSDIEGHWAKGRILAAAKRGIVNGLADGRFNPDGFVSISEAGTIVCRAFSVTGNSQGIYEKLDSNHWAYEYMQTLFSRGIFEKTDEIYDNFGENVEINRADCAMIISRALVLRK